MSRMTIALFLLSTVLTGCQWCDYARYSLSLATAKMESFVPHTCGPSGPCGECCNCVPHRPWTHGYCDDWDFHITQHTAQRCAFVDLHTYRARGGRPVSHHFTMGFIRAYEDLALNRCPTPPIVPPPLYWNAYYRSCAGKPCVEDWFAGYNAGLDMGMNSSVAQFKEVYLRRGNQACGPVASANYYDGGMGDAAPLQPPFPQPTPINPVNYRYGQGSY